MSLEPQQQNPLNQFKSYTAKHVIVGFRFSEDACSVNITGDIGVSGTVLPETRTSEGNCGGPAIVIINEIMDSTFIMYEAETTWEFFPNSTPTTGSYVGWMQIRDRVGMLFAHHLRKYCETLGMALGNITFAWKTFFVGTTYDDKEEVLTTNPLIFHVTEFAQSLSAGIGRAYYMSFAASYNTFGQLPQFSKLFQTTLTHADGNVNDEIQSSTVSNPALADRQNEDTYKNSARQQRLDKSKPMKTLQDVFNSMQTELTDQAFANKAQIQDWQASIRDDYTKKIIPPKQFLPDLPMKYTITLDPKYETYKINNRNMPFEQPEQDQRLEGIRALPFHIGTSLPNAIDTVMMLSREVGKDLQAAKHVGYRAVTTVIRGCEGNYNIHTNINPYVIPVNITDGTDTGPGEGVLEGPLHYFYQAGKNESRDIIAISYRSIVTPHQKPLEEETEGVDDIGVVYGNREPASMQRTPNNNNDFFTSGYSGNRGAIGIMDVNGLESASTASVIMANLAHVIKQDTSYSINIRGNPYILNDINRNPLDVRDGKGMGNSKWEYTLYDKVEILPMYMKLSIYLRPVADLISDFVDIDETYFYSGYLHINKIVTYFGQGASGFTQMIEGLRTEDSI